MTTSPVSPRRRPKCFVWSAGPSGSRSGGQHIRGPHLAHVLGPGEPGSGRGCIVRFLLIRK